VFTGIELPLEVAIAFCVMCLGAGVVVARWPALRRAAPRRSPLEDLLTRDALGPAIDLANRRNAMRETSHAVLQGRIDQTEGQRGVWNAELREQVAGIMRAGLRRGDSLSDIGKDGFTIIVPGADEHTASRIAHRLRRSLAQLRDTYPASLSDITASFGVAAGHRSDNDNLLIMRARAALKAAIARGEDHVIAASDIEEVMYLPAPAPSSTASAA
jgi:diguanylate cyclase (GGDEF)-like protein